VQTIPKPGAEAPAQAAVRERQRLYAAETEQRRRDSMRDLEELFDHRNDGVAADRRFREKLRFHVAMFGDGTLGTSAATILAGLLQDERRLRRAREAAR
jgi:hypothetical protein